MRKELSIDSGHDEIMIRHTDNWRAIMDMKIPHKEKEPLWQREENRWREECHQHALDQILHPRKNYDMSDFIATVISFGLMCFGVCAISGIIRGKK